MLLLLVEMRCTLIYILLAGPEKSRARKSRIDERRCAVLSTEKQVIQSQPTCLVVRSVESFISRPDPAAGRMRLFLSSHIGRR